MEIEDNINYHLTLMLKMVGVGGSHFLLESLCFSNNLCTIFAKSKAPPSGSKGTWKTLPTNRMLTMLELRGKLENELSQAAMGEFNVAKIVEVIQAHRLADNLPNADVK